MTRAELQAQLRKRGLAVGIGTSSKKRCTPTNHAEQQMPDYVVAKPDKMDEYLTISGVIHGP